MVLFHFEHIGIVWCRKMRHSVAFRVGLIDDAIVHRWWLVDITMLSRHRDSPPTPRNRPHPNTVFGKKMMEPLKGINTRWEENIYFNTLYVISLGNYTVYKIAGMREPLLCLALNCFWMHDCFLVSLSLSRFAITRTRFILWSGSTYHTFYKIRLSVVLRICKSVAIVLRYISLLCLCGKWNFMYCNVTGNR